MSDPPSPRVNPFELDRLLAGELDATEAARVRAWAEQDPEAARYLAARRAERDELMARLPPDILTARVAEAAQRPSPGSVPAHPPGLAAWRWLRRSWRALTLAAAAAVALFLLFPGRDAGTPREDLVWMGEDAAARLHVQRDGRVLADATPQVGDRVRFELMLPPGRTAYAAVLAVEGGRATPVLPAQGRSIEVVETGLLPGSVELAPGGGVVEVLLFARAEAFEPAALADEVTFAGADAVPDGLVMRFSVDLGP